MGLTCILDDANPVGLGLLHDRIHVGHLTIEMHRDNGGDPLPCLAFLEDPGLEINLALGFKEFLQLGWIHVVRALANVNEPRLCSSLGDCLRGCDKCIRNCDNDIPCSNPGRHQAEPHGICPTAHTDAIRNIAKLCKTLFEVFNRWSANKACAM